MFNRFVENPRRPIIIVLSIVAAYLIIGFLILPFIVKVVAVSKLSEALSREVTIETVRLNPLSFSATIRGFDVRKREGAGSLLSFDELYVNLQGRSIIKRGVTIKELRLDGPKVEVVRIDEQNFNFSDLVIKDKPNSVEKETPEEDESAVGLPFSINNIQITNGNAVFVDEPMKTTHTVEELAIAIPFISSLPPEVGIFVKPSFSAKINGTEFAFGGNTKPFTENHETVMEVKLSELSLPHYMAYSPVPLDFDLVSGDLSLNMELSYRQEAQASPALILSGIIEIVEIAIDDRAGLPMVRLPLLKVDVAPSELFKMVFRVREVLIDRPVITVERGKDGEVNLLSLIPASTGDKKVEAAPAPSEAPDIVIEAVRLKDGRADFVDRSVKPVYKAALTEIGVLVEGLTSGPGRAGVSINALLDGYAPFEITGSLDPLGSDLFVDLKIAFKNFSLSSVSPYTGKYIGNNISKGKLFLDLEYLIEERKLDAKNDLRIDSVMLGEVVQSEEATKLPVALALNLLKDRDGVIDIKMPLEGSLDDPEFSVFGIAIKMFLNLIIKAATSPFSVLGSIIGGGEEFSYVEFEPGSFLLLETDASKLEKLVTALYERPNLKIEVAGFVDMISDTESLRELKFLESLKERKFQRAKRRPGGPKTIDEVVIGAKEYEKYLWAAYKKTDFEKEKNTVGLTKKIELALMKELILEHTEVSEGDLRSLANARSAAVKDYLLTLEKMEAERVFIVWPDLLTPEAKEGVKNNRVDFTLK